MKRKTRHRMPWTGRVAILLLAIAVIPLAAVMTSRAEPKKTGRITRVTTSNQKAIIEVHGDETVEIVLQIAKSKRNKKKLEWTLGWSAAYRGPVTASISLSAKIKLNNKKTGRGIVYRLGTPFGYSQANIAMTEKDPLPIGTVRFRGKKATSGQASIQRKGDSVVFADIKQKDGKLVPISLLVRKKSSPRPSKRAVTARIEALGGKVHSSADFVIEISLFKTKATDRDLATIPVFDKLIGLGLAGTRVTDAGLAHIQNMTSLGSVDLNHTGISDDGLVFLKKLGKLSYLHLANTKVTDNGLVHVKQLKNMAFLNLNNTKVTNLGLVHLRKLTKLYTLILNGTRITDQGLVHLRKLPSMLDIRLSKTAVGDIGLEQLKDMSKLRTVVLTGTKVSGSGLRHLPTSVKTLWLPSTKVDDAGLRHLSHLKQLKSLVLSGTQVTDKGLVHLMKLKQLRTLSLHGTKVTNAGVERVKAALPACQVGR